MGEPLSSRGAPLAVLGAGLGAGLISGLLGVGGGMVMIPVLVLVVGLTQHQAHASSLAAIIPIGAVGAIGFALRDDVGIVIALALAVGAIAGAPLGAAAMARLSDRRLKIVFAVLQVAIGSQLLLS